MGREIGSNFSITGGVYFHCHLTKGGKYQLKAYNSTIESWDIDSIIEYLEDKSVLIEIITKTNCRHLQYCYNDTISRLKYLRHLELVESYKESGDIVEISEIIRQSQERED